MADLNRNDLRKFARLGAKARLEELRQEEAAIRRAFPDLSSRGGAAGATTADAPAAKATRRRRSRMSAAARKAVSERMRKYWAERRKAKGKTK